MYNPFTNVSSLINPSYSCQHIYIFFPFVKNVNCSVRWHAKWRWCSRRQKLDCMIASICIVLKIVYEVYRNTSLFPLNTKKMIGFDHIPPYTVGHFSPFPAFFGVWHISLFTLEEVCRVGEPFLVFLIKFEWVFIHLFFFLQLLFFSIFGFWSGWVIAL